MNYLFVLQVVSENGKYAHPANWAGYMLLGKDIVLRDRTVDLTKSFTLMLQAPLDYLVAALRTLLAMVSSVLCYHGYSL